MADQMTTSTPRPLGPPPQSLTQPVAPATPASQVKVARDSIPAVIAGVVALIAGGVMIVLAWNFAANWDCIQCQLPYLLSGSLPGLALIIIGSGILVLNAVRRDAAERSAQSERLTAAITELTALVGPRDPYDPSVIGEYRPRPRPDAQGGQEQPPVSAGGSFEQGR